MKNKPPLPSEYENERGYTLVEQLVALALLLAVLVPAGAFMVSFTNPVHLKDTMEARTLALSVMEKTLMEESYEAEVKESENKKWEIRKEVEREGRLIHLHVKVVKPGLEKPISAFKTIRYEAE